MARPASHVDLRDDTGVAVTGHELMEVVGTGGMSAVHRARQENLQRDVAVKITAPDRITAEDKDRFLREARVLAQLDHPNIVPVYDYGTDGAGRCFYTMKLVRGRTLKAMLTAVREGSQAASLERLLEVFRKVCDAIAFAHSRGVLHRDLKPENIMVGEFGEVLVMDWGLAGEIKGGAPARDGVVPPRTRASAAGSDVALTVEGEVLGTPQYMSPEQARAQADLDERCDVYALGGILYSILTLRPPLSKGGVQDMLESVRTGRIEPFEAMPGITQSRTTRWRIPPPLAAVVRKAMALDRTDRFASVGELAGDVDAHLAGFATTAEDINTAGLFWLFLKRHRSASISMVVLLVLSAVFMVQLVASERRANLSAAVARQNENTARINEDAARRAEQAAHASEAATLIALADSAYTTNNTGQMRGALDGVPAELRNTTWHYLDARADERKALIEFDRDPFLIGNAPHPLRPGVFAAAGSANHPEIFIFDAKTGSMLSSFKQRGGWPRGVAFSPDAKRIALGRIMGGGLSVHDAETGAELLHWDSAAQVDRLVYLPDGQRLLASGWNGCALWDSTTGKALWQLRTGQWHWPLPDGERIACISERKLRLLSATDGTVLATYEHRPATSASAALSPDGTVVVVAHFDGGVSARRLSDGGTIFDVPTSDHGGIHRIAFTADGRHFVTVGSLQDSTQCVQLCDTATGRVLRRLHGGTGNVESMSVHPLSGDLLIAGARSATFALPQYRAPKWRLTQGWMRGAFIARDDLYLTPTDQSSLDAIDLQTGEVLWRPLRPVANRVAISADSRTGIAQLADQPPGERDFTIFREDAQGLREIGTTRYGTDAGSLALNRDGSRAAMSGTWGVVHTRRTDGGPELPQPDPSDIGYTFDLAWHGSNPTRLLGVFNRFARRGMPGSEEWIVAWDTDTGKRVAAVPHLTAMNVLATEPGGTRFAEGGDDKLIRIRDADTLAILREFRAHDGAISAIAWHPQRPILATGSTDRSVRLWDVQTGRLIEELHLGLREPTSLHFSPTGRRLACDTPGEKTLIWELE